MDPRTHCWWAAALGWALLPGCAGDPVSVDWNRLALQPRNDWQAQAKPAPGFNETALILWRSPDAGRLVVGADGLARIVRDRGDWPPEGR